MLLSSSTFSDSTTVTGAEPHEIKSKLCSFAGFWRNVSSSYILSACWKSDGHLIHQYLSPARSLLACCQFSVQAPDYICDEISLLGCRL